MEAIIVFYAQEYQLKMSCTVKTFYLDKVDFIHLFFVTFFSWLSSLIAPYLAHKD